jgi:hypothetical protein
VGAMTCYMPRPTSELAHFASILAGPQQVWLGGNLGNCRVLPIEGISLDTVQPPKPEHRIMNLTDFERAAIRSLEQFPYSVWAIDELEVGLQIMQSVGIKSFMDGKLGKSCHWHEFGTGQSMHQ